MFKNGFLSHADAAQYNRNLVLNYIKDYGPISRTQIWDEINLSRASVTMIVRQLLEQDLVREVGVGESSGGRKPLFLQFNPDARQIYVVDYWEPRRVFLTNLAGEIIAESSPLIFKKYCSPEDFREIVMRGIKEIESKREVDYSTLLGLGFCMPGTIDFRQGVVLHSVELGWINVNMIELFANHFPNRVYLERTGNLMALGLCAKREDVSLCTHFMLILFATYGIGASLIIRGNCQHGSNYMVGEIGHSKFNDSTLCSCGQKGCLEAIIREEMAKNRGKVSEQALKYLALAISSAINLMDTSMVIIAGNLLPTMDKSKQEFLINEIKRQVYSSKNRNLTILTDSDGENEIVSGMSVHIFKENFGVQISS